MAQSPVQDYDPLEEQLNAWSHALGAGLAVIGAVFLLIKGSSLPLAQWIGLFGLCIKLSVAV